MLDFTEDNLWPDGVILNAFYETVRDDFCIGIVPYRFDNVYARYEELQASVLQAFAQLQALTCVHFVPVPGE